MTNRTETPQAEVKALVEMGNGVGGTKVSATDLTAIRENLRKAFANQGKSSTDLVTTVVR